MKKHILSAFGLIAAFTMSATQYMHINLPDGKEYDVKVEKTDRVSHVTEGEEVFIKVTRTDGSSSLYPMNGAEVTFALIPFAVKLLVSLTHIWVMKLHSQSSRHASAKSR